MASLVSLLVLFVIKSAVLSDQVQIPNNSIFPYSNAVRIANGQEATPGQFPWQVAIYRIAVGRLDFCGGSIISNRWVLTAAQCVSEAVRLVLYVGSVEAYEDNGIETTDYSIHPDWNPSEFYNDIGLIHLPEGSLTFNGFVKAIRLPVPTDYIGGGVNVTVSGWGKTAAGSSLPDVLNFAHLTTITNAVCLESGYTEKDIISSSLCVIGRPNQSICSGDSGSPLVAIDSNGLPYQVGIASHSFNSSCPTGAPSVFIRAEQYWGWITENTGISY